MSFLAGRVRLRRVTVLSVVNSGGSGVRWAAVGAAAGALATRCWLSGTPSWLERAPAWGPPGCSQLLDGQRSSGSVRSPFPAGGVWPVDTRGADRGCCAPRPGGGARGGACALGTRWGRVVLLDGGSSWAAPGRAALLEPPAAASAAAMRCPGNLLELWSKRGPANPRREGALLSRHEGVHQHTKTFWAGRRGSRADAAKQRGAYPGGAAKSTTS